MNNRFSLPRSGDVVGIVNTALCIAHCLALPVLVAMGATFMRHPAMTWAFIALATLSVAAAVRSTGRRSLAQLLWGALVVFALAMLLEDAHPVFEPLAIAASLALIAGHALNLRARRSG